MSEQQILNFLGIAKRARQTISGQELVLKAIKSGRANFVFLASDTSANAQQVLIKALNKKSIPFDLSFSQIELSQAIGQATKSIAVTDKGFAQRFQELVQNN
ncbi:ribosomal L7Ae/L30e/S12e/Gadd45 family protein [Bombilactobacillus folatiphilus]|uniref:Ribosomal L7Ae/L30e/S12e/Gadd45 family protein n=1 Tax=Bombilactobacillus folatiphilus TaxID=2923362 RepID=A0ABY4P7A5_9LACO|nr:ribosomal L7Ae/L30e/S12e/Gadd45 family protein [Bombilactobacillus folatiphilus]UQS81583.1 ribosomal L7Ae/L30e/S12e/Gadd45 family protein [Bombilactobacillus folatiphilus]